MDFSCRPIMLPPPTLLSLSLFTNFNLLCQEEKKMSKRENENTVMLPHKYVMSLHLQYCMQLCSPPQLSKINNNNKKVIKKSSKMLMKNVELLPNKEQLSRLEFLSLQIRCLRYALYMLTIQFIARPPKEFSRDGARVPKKNKVIQPF